MSPRRVVRATEAHDTDTAASTPHIQKSTLLSCMVRIFRVFWKCIKLVWYWLERVILVVLLFLLTIGLAWWLSQKPSNMRDWLPAESRLSEVSMSGNLITIKNVRNHTWQSESEFSPGYYDRTYNLDEIEGVYYLITPFSDRDGPAHTMLSFSFSGGIHVVISGEVRKERGESFDALKGILNQYELMYVIADESDVIKLRTHYRKNQVYMYPIQTEKQKIQLLFRSMVLKAEKLRQEPEFYNTFWNNCTTSILVHANALRQKKLPWNHYTILPAHSDEVLYDAGLIDTRLSLPDARAYYRIDELAQTASGEVKFSDVIRKPIQ